MNRYFLTILIFALLAACSPIVRPGATYTPIPSIPLATATLPATATLIEARQPSGGCDVLPRDQVEAILGPLNAAPQENPSIGEGIGSFEGCIYDGAAAFVILAYGPIGGLPARGYYEQILEQSDPGQVELLSGLGEAAFWVAQDEFSGQLYVLRGDVVLSLLVSGENAHQIAAQIAPLALARIP